MKNDQFEIKLDDKNGRKFLIPTAEVILTNMVKDKIINVQDLPMRLVASTPCFRKEAGSYGKDTKGMIRQHQFYKVELVSIVELNQCISELERMTNCATMILDKLMLPYRKVCFCVQVIWDLVLKKLMILKYGCHLKIDTEKFQVVLPVDRFKQEE